jgi:hypothetical protein
MDLRKTSLKLGNFTKSAEIMRNWAQKDVFTTELGLMLKIRSQQVQQWYVAV